MVSKMSQTWSSVRNVMLVFTWIVLALRLEIRCMMGHGYALIAELLSY